MGDGCATGRCASLELRRRRSRPNAPSWGVFSWSPCCGQSAAQAATRANVGEQVRELAGRATGHTGRNGSCDGHHWRAKDNLFVLAIGA